MVTWDWIGIAAAVAAIAGAMYAGVQARAAKRQAASSEESAKNAKEQLVLMQAQVKAAERQNELTAQALAHEVDARKFKLDVLPRINNYCGADRLELVVENNTQQMANIQAVYILFDDGSRFDWIGLRTAKTGQIEVATDMFSYWRLPARLAGGHAGSFFFFDKQPKPNARHGFVTIDVDFSKPRWRTIKSVVVRANNEDFEVKDGDWRERIRWNKSVPLTS